LTASPFQPGLTRRPSSQSSQPSKSSKHSNASGECQGAADSETDVIDSLQV
jgi:hypothetical protein